MPSLSRQQLVLLVLLTVVWGITWPIMKLGVNDFAPLSFRTLSIWLGIPVLAAALWVLKVPFAVPRRHWPALLWLAATAQVDTDSPDLADHPGAQRLLHIRIVQGWFSAIEMIEVCNPPL